MGLTYALAYSPIVYFGLFQVREEREGRLGHVLRSVEQRVQTDHARYPYTRQVPFS